MLSAWHEQGMKIMRESVAGAPVRPAATSWLAQQRAKSNGRGLVRRRSLIQKRSLTIPCSGEGSGLPLLHVYPLVDTQQRTMWFTITSRVGRASRAETSCRSARTIQELVSLVVPLSLLQTATMSTVSFQVRPSPPRFVSTTTLLHLASETQLANATNLALRAGRSLCTSRTRGRRLLLLAKTVGSSASLSR